MLPVKDKIIIHEVGLRDGLQIEAETVPLDVKLRWYDRLVSAGIPMIQVGSFVHPAKVPQMADTDLLFQEIHTSGRKRDDVLLTALVLNEKGLERGLKCNVDMFCMGVSASNTHSKKNTGMSTAEALDVTLDMAKNALRENRVVQVSVQSAFGCGYEGPISKKAVLEIVQKYRDAGLNFISLADTAGYGFPDQVYELFSEIQEMDKNIKMACHFHDTFGAGIANCTAALKAGVTVFEASFGGLGGCPFTKISSGNVCTEDLVYLLTRLGITELPDLGGLIELTKNIAAHFERDLTGRLYKTGIPTIIKGDFPV